MGRSDALRKASCLGFFVRVTWGHRERERVSLAAKPTFSIFVCFPLFYSVCFLVFFSLGVGFLFATALSVLLHGVPSWSIWKET